MKLSTHLVKDILSAFHISVFVSSPNAFAFEEIRLFDPASFPLQKEILYVCTFKELSLLTEDAVKSAFFVCLATQEQAGRYVDLLHGNLILVSPEHSLSQLVNTLYSGFQRIQAWARDLDEAILAHEDYPSIFSIGSRFFGHNAMLMVNSSYNVIGTNLLACPNNKKIDFILKNGYYSKNLTDGLAQMGYMAKGFQYKEATMINPPNFMGCPLMVLSMHAENGIFLGFITLYFIESTPTEGQFELFSYFAKAVRRYYLESNIQTNYAPTPFEAFLGDLINHTQGDEAFLQDRARTLRLPLDAHYRLCVVQWDHFILPQADYVRNRLRTSLRFPTFRVVLYHESVILLLEGDVSSVKVIEEMNESLGEFGSLLTICKGYAGFSTSGFPLLKLNIAYKQATTAVQYGRMLLPESNIYFFSQYYIYEMLDSYKSSYALKDMYVQRLNLLRNPSENNYDNLSLLKNYLLTERSISTTAKIMHMHRNSVIYRLGKIQDVLNLDLNDPDVRLRLLISFKILELIEGHISLPAEDLPPSEEDSMNSYE